MSINDAVLGILSYKPMTGYDLKKIIQHSSFMYWSGNNNQIYKALSELLDQGLVTHEVKHQEGAPTKKIYKITDAGLAALKEWALSPPEPMDMKKPFLIHLAWSRQLNTDELHRLIDAYEDQINTQLLLEKNKDWDAHFSPDRTDLETTIWHCIKQNIVSTYEHERTWIKQLRAAIANIPNDNDQKNTGVKNMQKEELTKTDKKEAINMTYTFFEDDTIVYVESDDILITDVQSALDLMMTIQYEKNCSKVILDKDVITETFFSLRSGIAGEVLQKFINYRTKLAIVGDFSTYTSKALRDFIYECNNGNDIFFADNLGQAVKRLASAN